MLFPDDGNGSRILLTSRILELAGQSWKLLRERVFGQQYSCPPQLVEVGKKIAKDCGGLPLTIVVVAGLVLSSGNVMSEQVWGNISENISSREPTIALQCSKILCFSYDRLPLRLKPCFLYIAAFPEDSDIDVSKLIRLWVAEGFLKPNHHFKCLEDVGERYLEDLVERSLVLVSKKGPDGKLETVGIHDMLREICITKAEEEWFFHHHVRSKRYPYKEFIENPYRRLKIHIIERCSELNINDLSVRSILFDESLLSFPSLHVRSRHVCILDAPRAYSENISYVFSTFVNLWYFAFSLSSPPSSYRELPVLISKHPNLETVVVRVFLNYGIGRNILEVPYEILKAWKLRLLIWETSFRLTYPSDIGNIVYESGLQTIETVIDFIFEEEMIRILVNLKKLKVGYYMENRNWGDFNFDRLSKLLNLEDLEIRMYYNFSTDYSMTWKHVFPMGLKKLYLEVGKQRKVNFLNSSISIPMPRKLDYLLKWEMEKEHFPCLESLILDRAIWIDKFPSGVGEIDLLQYIELNECKISLVDSAKQIQRHQHENGNDAFRVRVIDYKGENVLF
ncbi:putative late blight resistance protein homolog R1B-23 [Henckelia pumila]|uniref:putative late blight resistance protein homolog R1B-23 n=1 Tax=Henckelia pumila TaxID=405737 RepID=UPI003C6E96B6